MMRVFADPSPVAEAAARLQALIARPLAVAAQSVNLSGYVGVAISLHAADADGLLSDADLALHAAKVHGAGHVVRYEPALRAALVEPSRLRGELPAAIRRGELFLEYQPIVELATRRIEGFEALARWRHPELGRLGPDRFIQVAEAAGCIDELGVEVLRQALRGAARLNRAAGRPVFVDVNVSPHQLIDPAALIGALRAGLSETSLNPALIVIELTETGLGANETLVEAVLHRLHETGIRLAIDDFGTGYSSLSRLRQLPIDTVKIDKSFVSGLCPGGPLELITGIVDIAHSMHLTVVAEGVETGDVNDLLLRAGCGYGQGYLYSRPVDLPAAAGQLPGVPVLRIRRELELLCQSQRRPGIAAVVHERPRCGQRRQLQLVDLLLAGRVAGDHLRGLHRSQRRRRARQLRRGVPAVRPVNHRPPVTADRRCGTALGHGTGARMVRGSGWPAGRCRRWAGRRGFRWPRPAGGPAGAGRGIG